MPAHCLSVQGRTVSGSPSVSGEITFAYHHIAIKPYPAAQYNVFPESTHFAVRWLLLIAGRFICHLAYPQIC